MEGVSFEDVIRTAVSLGGDADTLTDIAGAMAEAYYGCDDFFKEQCESRISEDMKQILYKFNKAVNQGVFEQEKVDIKEPVKDERNYRRTTIDDLIKEVDSKLTRDI